MSSLWVIGAAVGLGLILVAVFCIALDAYIWERRFKRDERRRVQDARAEHEAEVRAKADAWQAESESPAVECPECGTKARHHVMARDCRGGFQRADSVPGEPSCRREFRGRPHWHFRCRACLASFGLSSGFVTAIQEGSR